MAAGKALSELRLHIQVEERLHCNTKSPYFDFAGVKFGHATDGFDRWCLTNATV